MRISDWSSDVCSSDLMSRSLDELEVDFFAVQQRVRADREDQHQAGEELPGGGGEAHHVHAGAHHEEEEEAEQRAQHVRLAQIGRASCRESVCQSECISVIAVSLMKTTNQPQQY